MLTRTNFIYMLNIGIYFRQNQWFQMSNAPQASILRKPFLNILLIEANRKEICLKLNIIISFKTLTLSNEIQIHLNPFHTHCFFQFNPIHSRHCEKTCKCVCACDCMWVNVLEELTTKKCDFALKAIVSFSVEHCRDRYLYIQRYGCG